MMMARHRGLAGLLGLQAVLLLGSSLLGVVDGADCYADERGDRIMKDRWTNEGMTRAACDQYCDDRGFYYYGVQWGIECWCAESGTDLGKHGSGKCDYECGGDSSETCGGYLAFEAEPVGGEALSQSDLAPNPSPTPVPTLPSSCELSTPDFRYNEKSGVDGRLYAEGKGCFTMSDLYNFIGEWNDGKTKGPVYVLNDDDAIDYYPDKFTGKWLLAAELYVTGGGTFYCQGTSEGGDCNELRIESRGSNAYHEIRGWGGNLYFDHTVVTSWDTNSRKPQESYTNGRSFINCVSEETTGDTCKGHAEHDMGECRMDILDSEIGYLGYDSAEAYGITWKVRGFCSDLSNEDVFSKVNVYGDIKDSDIHHNYYGHYSFGLQGGYMTNNKMHDNHQYGFDPHDDSDYLTIANNEVYNNVNHGIIASKRCNNVKIYGNTVRDGGEHAVGIFLHRSSNDCEVYDNTITNMGDAGIALLESEDADIYNNRVDGAEFGIRLNLGSRDNLIRENTFNDIWNVGLFTYFGSDTPWESDGRPHKNKFYDNKISGTEVGVKLKHSDYIEVKDNDFSGTKIIEFSDTYGTKWSGNSLPADTCLINQYDSSTFTSTAELPPEC